jgi:hypothetical protein
MKSLHHHSSYEGQSKAVSHLARNLATCSTIEEQKDYTGNDICSDPSCPGSSTAEGCCNLCASTSGCGAFTWTNYNGGTCWLKSGKTASTSCAGCRSATLRPLVPNWESCTIGIDTCADNWVCCVAPADCSSQKTTCRPGGNECSSCTVPAKTPVAKPAVKPVQKPVIKPVTKPVQKPVVTPVVKPVQKPVIKPVAKPVQKPVVAPVAKPVQKPVIKPVAKPVQKPVSPPVTMCSSIEEQIDYTGNDICTTSCPKSSTAEGCCSLCAATSGCGAFTWTNSNGGTCWLKSGKTASTSCAGCRSATIRPLIPNWISCTMGIDICADNWVCCVAPADCSSQKTTCRPGGSECSSCTVPVKTPVVQPIVKPVQKPVITPVAKPVQKPVSPLVRSCSSIEEQIDYTGNDICTTSCPKSSTAEGCCSICAATSGCGAFTWTNSNEGTCWLKSGKTASTSCAGCRSAWLGPPIPNWESCTKGIGTCADNWLCCVAPADCSTQKTTCRPGGTECSSCTSNGKTLSLLNRITGTQVVAGQHNDEKQGSNWAYYTNLVQQATGKYPGLWSGDFVYSQLDHSPMVQEALRQWNSGAIINLMWHGCPPRPGSDYTCGWEGGVKSYISNDEWASLITDGSSWNVEWKKRMDYIGNYLKTLQSQGVEVMFRPLHEMNQVVFWWGGRTGASGTRRLYQITRDYMEKTLGLTNLVWVWDVQDLTTNYWEYNPGANYFDVAALDIYGNGFWDDSFYQALLNEAGNKPVGIGESFQIPDISYLNSHNRLSFFMVWADQGDQTSNAVKATYSSGKVLTRENLNRG